MARSRHDDARVLSWNVARSWQLLAEAGARLGLEASPEGDVSRALAAAIHTLLATDASNSPEQENESEESRG